MNIVQWEVESSLFLSIVPGIFLNLWSYYHQGPNRINSEELNIFLICQTVKTTSFQVVLMWYLKPNRFRRTRIPEPDLCKIHVGRGTSIAMSCHLSNAQIANSLFSLSVTMRQVVISLCHFNFLTVLAIAIFHTFPLSLSLSFSFSLSLFLFLLVFVVSIRVKITFSSHLPQATQLLEKHRFRTVKQNKKRSKSQRSQVVMIRHGDPTQLYQVMVYQESPR